MRELETVKVIHKPHCMAYFCDDGTIRDGDDADAKFVAKREHILSLASQSARVQRFNYSVSRAEVGVRVPGSQSPLFSTLA